MKCTATVRTEISAVASASLCFVAWKLTRGSDVDQSRHYLDRASPDRVLVSLMLAHLDQLERWSAGLRELRPVP